MQTNAPLISFSSTLGAFDAPKIVSKPKTDEKMDLNIPQDASLEALKEQQKKLEAEIKAKQAQFQKKVIEQILIAVKANDIPVDMLVAALGGPKRRKGVSAKPLYKDPDTEATWSGRGKTPTWLRDVPKEDWDIYKI